MTLVLENNIWVLWGIITFAVALSVWLESRFKWAAKLSALVIVLVLGIILSNVRVIPKSSGVYDVVTDYLVPLALAFLLFRADLKKICKESGRMLIAFLIGALGTVVGSFVAYLAFYKALRVLPGLTAMFTGTYTGGSVNFAALSVSFDVPKKMVSAATIADNLNMAVYFFILLSIPVKMSIDKKTESHPKEAEKKEISLTSLAIGIASAVIIVAASQKLGNIIGNQYLWITTLSVACATLFPNVFGKIAGLQELGTFFIYCFMFVIGAPASISEIIKNSPYLLVFAMIIVLFNMIFTFAGGKLLKFDRKTLIIASNANVGGPTTAASMAIAKGWDELVGPALLIGSLGYVIGNYLGLMVGYVCGLF